MKRVSFVRDGKPAFGADTEGGVVEIEVDRIGTFRNAVVND